MSSSHVVGSISATATSQRRSPKPTRAILGLLIISSLLALGIYWWSEHKYEYIPKRWGVVVPGKIYRSGQLTHHVLENTLREHGITTIIDLQLNDLQDVHLQAEIEYAARHGIRHFRFGLGGNGTGDPARYADAVAILIQCERDNQPVLVHCAAGTQRTGGIVACYRLLVEEADPREVHKELKQYHWNPRADRDLIDYLNANLPRIAEMLVERGALDRMPAVIPPIGRITFQ